MTIVLQLPFPPSVNRIWRHVVILGRSATLLSKEGREYRKRVEYAVLMANAQVNMTSRLAVSVEVYPPDLRRRDLDNAFKGILDSLEHAGVFKDDSQIDDLRIVRRDLCRPDGKVIVTISELAEKGD